MPRLLRVSLIFPYAHGTVIAARRYTSGGTEGLDRALVDGPVSTQQVLFPESSQAIDFVALPYEQLAPRLESRSFCPDCTPAGTRSFTLPSGVGTWILAPSAASRNEIGTLQ